MIPTIATVTLGGSLEDRLRAAAAAGFAGVELFEADLGRPAASAATLRRMAADAGVELVDFFPLRDVEGVPAARRPAVLERAARLLDFAASLGAGMVMACSNVQDDSLAEPERIAADLQAVGELAAARGLRLAYEALSWGRHVRDYGAAWELVRQADHPAVGLVLDSFHVLARRLDLAPIRDIPAGRIFLVQISDAPMLDTDYMDWSRGHRTLPGRGALALDRFARAVRATGYDGVVSLECFSDALRAEPAERVARDGFAALDALWSEAAPATETPG